MTKRQQKQFDALLRRIEDIYCGVLEMPWSEDDFSTYDVDTIDSLSRSIINSFDIDRDKIREMTGHDVIPIYYVDKFKSPLVLTTWLFSFGVRA